MQVASGANEGVRSRKLSQCRRVDVALCESGVLHVKQDKRADRGLHSFDFDHQIALQSDVEFLADP